MKSPEHDIEVAYDHLDNLGQYNAAEIREAIQMTTSNNDEFSAEAIMARNHHVEVDDARHYDINETGWQEAFSDPATRQITITGMQALRAAQHKPSGDDKHAG